MRTRDEDECLRDDSDLEVDNGVELRIVVVTSSCGSTIAEGDTKLTVEPVSADADSNEGDPAKVAISITNLKLCQIELTWIT